MVAKLPLLGAVAEGGKEARGGIVGGATAGVAAENIDIELRVGGAGCNRPRW